MLKSNGVARGRDTKSARLKLLRDKAKRANAVKAAKKGEKRAVAQATQATKNSAKTSEQAAEATKTATEKLIAPRAWWVAVVMAVVLLFVFIISVLFGKVTTGQHVPGGARNTAADAKVVEVFPKGPRPAGLESALANDIR